jgi:hypothetical protein
LEVVSGGARILEDACEPSEAHADDFELEGSAFLFGRPRSAVSAETR